METSWNWARGSTNYQHPVLTSSVTRTGPDQIFPTLYQLKLLKLRISSNPARAETVTKRQHINFATPCTGWNCKKGGSLNLQHPVFTYSEKRMGPQQIFPTMYLQKLRKGRSSSNLQHPARAETVTRRQHTNFATPCTSWNCEKKEGHPVSLRNLALRTTSPLLTNNSNLWTWPKRICQKSV